MASWGFHWSVSTRRWSLPTGQRHYRNDRAVQGIRIFYVNAFWHHPLTIKDLLCPLAFCQFDSWGREWFLLCVQEICLTFFNSLFCISFHVKQVLTWLTNIYRCQHVGRSGEIILSHARDHDLKDWKYPLTIYKVWGFVIVFDWVMRWLIWSLYSSWEKFMKTKTWRQVWVCLLAATMGAEWEPYLKDDQVF